MHGIKQKLFVNNCAYPIWVGLVLTEIAMIIGFKDLVVVRPAPGQMKFNEFLDLVEKRAVNATLLSAYLEYTNMSGYLEGYFIYFFFTGKLSFIYF